MTSISFCTVEDVISLVHGKDSSAPTGPTETEDPPMPVAVGIGSPMVLQHKGAPSPV
jgi:hypothetical protein